MLGGYGFSYVDMGNWRSTLGPFPVDLTAKRVFVAPRARRAKKVAQIACNEPQTAKFFVLAGRFLCLLAKNEPRHPRLGITLGKGM